MVNNGGVFAPLRKVPPANARGTERGAGSVPPACRRNLQEGVRNSSPRFARGTERGAGSVPPDFREGVRFKFN